MSIIEKTGQSKGITEDSRALQLFTNRHEIIKHFATLLNDDISAEQKTPEQILFFHGDGGNGKSLLLRFLRERCCKRIDDWQYVKDLEGEAFVVNLTDSETAKEMPSALIDFASVPALGEGSIQETTTALLRLRRELGEHGFRFPVFDFACVWYLHKARNLSGDKIKEFFPAQDVISSIIDAATQTSWGSIVKAAGAFLGKKLQLDKSYTLFMHKRKLDENQFAEIEGMDAKTELLDELPRFFAEDLAAAMQADDAPERVVLFFDTHEAFWSPQEREHDNDRFFYRDEWLRKLLGSLDLANGIIAIVAGREVPRWAKASRVHIPEEYLNLWLVAHLSNHDAGIYLERAGVADPAMQQALIAYASVAPNEVHPLYLGMCVDVVNAANEKGTPVTPADFSDMPQMEKREQELFERFLRYVDVNVGYAVRALSACRAFNFEIYQRLGNEMKFQADAPSFEVLLRFSFIWKSKGQREGWYRIHDLVRRLGRQNQEELVRRAYVVMEEYYRELVAAGDEFAISEAIYHTNQGEWERGVNEWLEVFDRTLQLSRYKLCEALLDVRSEMMIGSDFYLGWVSSLEGNYFQSLSRHENARQEYHESIIAFDKALALAPDDVYAHNNKGLSLQALGDLQARMSQHSEALQSYADSIIAFDKALALAPDYINGLFNKALALRSKSNLHETLNQLQEARECWTIALREVEHVLRIAPNDSGAQKLRDYFQNQLDE